MTYCFESTTSSMYGVCFPTCWGARGFPCFQYVRDGGAAEGASPLFWGLGAMFFWLLRLHHCLWFGRPRFCFSGYTGSCAAKAIPGPLQVPLELYKGRLQPPTRMSLPRTSREYGTGAQFMRLGSTLACSEQRTPNPVEATGAGIPLLSLKNPLSMLNPYSVYEATLADPTVQGKPFTQIVTPKSVQHLA